jgi:hypothetical protein
MEDAQPVEEHLHDAVAEEVASGKTRNDAERAAVARMGAVHEVTGRPVSSAQPTIALLRRGALAGFLVGGVALVAYCLAGLISWAMAATRGSAFVTAPFPPGSYSQADCARWLAGDRAAPSCVAAMLSDHVGDIVLQGFTAGAAGVLLLLIYRALRLRRQDRATLTVLPAGSAEAVGAALAGLVALAGLGEGVDIEVIRLRWHGRPCERQPQAGAQAPAAQQAGSPGERRQADGVLHAVRARLTPEEYHPCPAPPAAASGVLTTTSRASPSAARTAPHSHP